MADSKISALAAITTLDGDELVPVVDTPSGTPTNKVITVANLLAGDDEAYGAGWNGSLEFPTKNAVYDKIETISAGGTPTRRGCRVYKNSTTAVGTGSLTALASFNAERFDTDAYHDLVTNTGRITIPSGLGGTYLLGAHLEWAANATGIHTAYLRVNGTQYIAAVRFNAASGGNTTGLTVTTVWTLAATDYVEVVVYQDSGGNLNLNASNRFEQEFFALLVAGS